MKKNKLLRSMDLIDEVYIEEADPTHIKRSRRPAWYRVAAIAACMALVFTSVGVGLFLGRNQSYEDSEYYDIIQKLTPLMQKKNNSWSDLFLAKEEVVIEKSVDMAVADSNAGGVYTYSSSSDATLGDAVVNTNGSYQEVTDNQVSGVIEADIIKRTDNYIFHMNQGMLRIYSIAKENSQEVGSFSFAEWLSKEKPLMLEGYTYQNPHEFYLSADGNTVMAMLQTGSGKNGSEVTVLSLDVSDPTKITEKNRMCVSGSYDSSRLVDGKLLLFTQYAVAHEPDFSDPATFIPQIDIGEGLIPLSAESIVYPAVLSSSRYTVVCLMDENTLEMTGTAAFLSYAARDLYVSAENIYAFRNYVDRSETPIKGEENVDFRLYVAMTEIACLSYADGTLEHKGAVKVKGSVLDRYSMDEYEGILRVVTSTTENESKIHRYSADEIVVSNNRAKANASLYCVDINTLEIVAEVADFAPEGETVRSARFDGPTGYVCTAIELSDPVFFFDLSDIQNITYKETGTIEGFSSSLVNFGDGYLLGIGIGASRSDVKIEIYEETQDGVASVCKYERMNCGYSTNYKSYYINREESFVGLGLTEYQTGESTYVLLYFDGYDLHPIVDVPLSGGNDIKRAVYIDGYFYMFGDEFKVQALQ